MAIISLFEGLLELLAPHRCPGCDLEFQPKADVLCAACEPLLEKAAEGFGAAYLYEGPLADAVRRYKYASRRELAEPLARLMVASLTPQALRADVVCPVPMHPKRLIKRGFNPAGLLATRIARELSLPLDTRSLRRIKDGPQQAGLSPQARLLNVQDAFVAVAAPAATVLLIDDVWTTGATLSACALALQDAGVETVIRFALARAEP